MLELRLEILINSESFLMKTHLKFLFDLLQTPLLKFVKISVDSLVSSKDFVDCLTLYSIFQTGIIYINILEWALAFKLYHLNCICCLQSLFM